MMMFILLIGMISELEPRFCSLRSCIYSSFRESHLIIFLWYICIVLINQGFLEKNIQDFQLYKSHSDNYICSLIPGSPNFQAQYTPGDMNIRPSQLNLVVKTDGIIWWWDGVNDAGGLLYKGSESNLQYVTTSSFLLLTYAKYLKSGDAVASCGGSTISANKLVSAAKKQVDYILGENPAKMSYMVGFGQRYPQHVHHRGSSLPSIHARPGRIACEDGFHYLSTPSPNPNILLGAILGGPDNRDNFADDRNNYRQSEPATYINAPFLGALAFFSHQQL